MIQLIPGGFLKEVVEDTTPVLGGNLDGGGNDISNVGKGTFSSLAVDGTILVVNVTGYLDKVGVGTSTPEGRFHVAGTVFPICIIERDTDYKMYGVNAATLRAHCTQDMETGFGPEIGFQIQDNTSAVEDIGEFAITRGASDDDGKFELFVRKAGVKGTAKLAVDADGKVGIGVTPTAKLDINSDILRLRTAKTPATAGAAGNAGDICWDASYLYACVAANTWKRAAILTW